MPSDSHLDENGFVVLDNHDSSGIAPHAHRAQIAACALCDADGYRGSTICDHQEHASAETRAAAREALRVALARNHTGVTPPIAPGDAQPRESATGGDAVRLPWWEVGGDAQSAAGDDGKRRPCDGCQRGGCPEQCPYVPASNSGAA